MFDECIDVDKSPYMEDSDFNFGDEDAVWQQDSNDGVLQNEVASYGVVSSDMIGGGGVSQNIPADVQHALNVVNDYFLPDEMVINAAQRACDFFGIPMPPIQNSPEFGVCVFTNNPDTLYDDAFGFSREQMMEMGIRGEDSMTLVFTHECAHRALQQFCGNLSPHTQELICDYFAGIHAAANGIDITNFVNSLRDTVGGPTHPDGILRSDSAESGVQAYYDLKEQGVDLTFNNCLDYFFKHYNDAEGIFSYAPSAEDIDYYQHMVNITSGSEQAHYIEKLGQAINASRHGFAGLEHHMPEGSDVGSGHVLYSRFEDDMRHDRHTSFTGSSKWDDDDYNIKAAKEAEARGDYETMNKHLRRVKGK